MSNPHVKTMPLLCLIVLILFSAPNAFAYPTLFNSRCVSCHADDTPSCNGCHEHRGNLSAITDQDVYAPGSLVTVTVSGGEEYGWIRGLLNDESGNELDRRTGPTGTGDDGEGNAITFPVTLQAPAPNEPGPVTWQAGWFGGLMTSGAHGTDLVSVSFTVEASSHVPDESQPAYAWDSIKALYK